MRFEWPDFLLDLFCYGDRFFPSKQYRETVTNHGRNSKRCELYRRKCNNQQNGKKSTNDNSCIGIGFSHPCWTVVWIFARKDCVIGLFPGIFLLRRGSIEQRYPDKRDDEHTNEQYD